MDKKALVRKYRGAVRFLCGVHNAPSRLAVRSRGKGNRVIAPCALLKHVKIRFNGSGNTVIVGDFSRLDHVELYISGNDNVVEIGPWCTLVKTVFCTEDGGNKITIGQGCRLLGAAELAAIESTQITIGRDCLFSGGIHFRTGDSHSLLDGTGKRINPSRDIAVGDHVWLGMGATLLKGAQVGPDCVVGSGAIVTGPHPGNNQVLAGVPARPVKTGINWDIRRLPVEPEIQGE